MLDWDNIIFMTEDGFYNAGVGEVMIFTQGERGAQ